MLNFLNALVHDPTYFGLALTVLGWLGHKAWSLVSSNQRDQLDTWETYAKNAAAWALVHFPGLDADQLSKQATDELARILAAQGIRLPDLVLEHLQEILRGFIHQQLLARSNRAPAEPPRAVVTSIAPAK